MSVATLLLVALFALSAWATDADIYLSADRNGQSRATDIPEGDEVWIVVIDPDQNIDCDIRDKMWPMFGSEKLNPRKRKVFSERSPWRTSEKRRRLSL